MDRNWLLKGELSQYDVEGIVLIDELETHLHVELQRKILPFLTEFFPRIQFIITTHSAYILNSISNACIYDLDKQVRFADFSSYSADEIAEAILTHQIILPLCRIKFFGISILLSRKSFPIVKRPSVPN